MNESNEVRGSRSDTSQTSTERPVIGVFTEQVVRRRRGGTVLEEDVAYLLDNVRLQPDLQLRRRRREGTVLAVNLGYLFHTQEPVMGDWVSSRTPLKCVRKISREF